MYSVWTICKCCRLTTLWHQLEVCQKTHPDRKEKRKIELLSAALLNPSRTLNALLPNVQTCVKVQNNTVKPPPTDSPDFCLLQLPLRLGALAIITLQRWTDEYSSAAHLARMHPRTRTFWKLKKDLCKTWGLTRNSWNNSWSVSTIQQTVLVNYYVSDYCTVD